MKKLIAHSAPSMFCLLLLTLAVFWSLSAAIAKPPGAEASWWPFFYSFLPMLSFLPVCFMLVGLETYQLHQQIAKLQQKLTELQTAKGP